MAVRCAVLEARCSTTGTNPWAVPFGATDPLKIPIDPNGNLASKTEGTDNWVYTWNAENQLTKVEKNGSEVARYGYDPGGRRVEKVAGGAVTSYTYEGQDIVREARGATTLKYVHGQVVDEPLAMDDGTALSYFHADGLGSIVKVTNTAGSAAQSRQYDAWGRLEAGAGEPGHAFTGREWDGETGLYYYRARYYDPTSGRFMSADPIGFNAGPNFYAYALNDPVGLLDPFGLDAVTSDPNVRACMCEIWKASGYGFTPKERAAWVISDGDTYKCIRWPWSAQDAKETWKAPRPGGQQGVVHTHPDALNPKPSTCNKCDADTAKQIDKPVYTVSRKGVWKVSPTGEITQEEPPEWTKSCECQKKK